MSKTVILLEGGPKSGAWMHLHLDLDVPNPLPLELAFIRRENTAEFDTEPVPVALYGLRQYSHDSQQASYRYVSEDLYENAIKRPQCKVVAG